MLPGSVDLANIPCEIVSINSLFYVNVDMTNESLEIIEVGLIAPIIVILIDLFC